MRTSGSHILIVFYLTFNLRTPIQVVGGVILFIDFVFYFIYYPVENYNITILNILDKLLTFF